MKTSFGNYCHFNADIQAKYFFFNLALPILLSHCYTTMVQGTKMLAVDISPLIFNMPRIHTSDHSFQEKLHGFCHFLASYASCFHDMVLLCLQINVILILSTNHNLQILVQGSKLSILNKQTRQKSLII